MKINLKKRYVIKLCSFFLFGILLLGGFVFKYFSKSKNLEMQLSNEYSKSMEELSEGLKNINVSLEKSLYASTATQFSLLASELSTEAKTAKDALANLPVTTADLSTVNKFLSQVGNYTLYLSKKVISGEEINSDERQLLSELKNTANSISESVDEVRASYQSADSWVNELGDKIDDTNIDGIATKLTEIEEALTDYPTLIYDGPFADNIYTAQSKMIEGKDEIGIDEALNRAAAAMGVLSGDLTAESTEEGKIPSYVFTGNNLTATVSKNGGYVVYFRKFREIGEGSISFEKAVELAKKYVNDSGNNFTETYYFTEDNMCVVSLVHKEGATLCYPDMIKVGVALDNGEIVMLESRSYLMNHQNRNISSPKNSELKARSVLSEELKVISVNKVIIPTVGRNEAQCYEFYCKTAEEKELLVYINMENLEEENILLLLKLDGGTLTK